MNGKWENPNVPHSGWMCVDIQDFGKPVATCQMCEKETIRYAHYMRHSKYPQTLMVGCVCAGRMEGDLQNAKERDAFMKSRMNKRKNWLARNWKLSRNGNQYVKSDGFIVVVKCKDDGMWSAFVKSENGDFEKWSTRNYANEEEMKLAAFDCLTKVLAEKKTPQKVQTTPSIYPSVIEQKKINRVENQQLQNTERNLFSHSLTTDEVTVPDVKTITLPNTERRFTSEQNHIFEFIKSGAGHGIIDAVAGAGKTTTIMECAKYVEDPSDVLFCAFNKSIQIEIAKKFRQQGFNQVMVKTVHALGFQMLKDNNNTGKNFAPQETKYWTILNKDINVQHEIRVFVNELLRINGYELNETDKNKQFAVKDILHKFKEKLLEINQKIRVTLSPYDINIFKNLMEHYHIFTEIETEKKFFDKELNIYFECTKILLQAGNHLAKEALIVDYTDMLYLPYIWNLRAIKRYSFLFIDECQDLSKAQLAVVLKYGKNDGRILAVGDPYQSIYGFAGADIEAFNRIKNIIKAKELSLTTCFRCPPNVVALAASIRSDISAKKLQNGKIEEIHIKQVVKMARKNDLIISRFREPLLFLVFEFINHNIQVQIHNDEVNDIIDELKNLFKQEERAAIIEEIPDKFENLKETVLHRWLFIIEKEAKRLSDFSERQIYIQTKTEYLSNKMEFLHKKYLQWKPTCQTINDMLLKIRDFITATDDCIKLSTIHRAKGLEAGRVFVLNFDDLPVYKPNQKPWERVQEENLKYVAITRTLNDLFLVKSEKIEVMRKEASLFDEFIADM